MNLNPTRNEDPVVLSSSMDRRSALESAFLVAGGVISSEILMPGSGSAVASATTVAIPTTFTLRPGNVQMPVLALNTVGLSAEDAERAVGYAFDQGMRHVDFHPGKERDGVAAYLQKHPNSRTKLFLNMTP